MTKITKGNVIKNLEFDPHALACEELRHVYRGKSSNQLIVLFSGFIAAAMLAWDIGIVYGCAWYAWLLVAHAWHWWLGRLDFVSANISAELARINRHVMAAAFAGLGWGALAIALPLLSRPSKAAILIIMLIGVIVALPRLVVFLPIFFAFAAGVYVPLLLATPFLDFETLHMVMVMLVAVGATLWASASEIRKILIDVLLKQVASEQASWEDKLTGIGNRRSFDTNFANQWAQASRAKVPLSLMMVDVDFFKKFNDNYGHQAGDECLRQVAQALDGCARRAGDSVTRYGGEEFAVVLFHTSLNEAQNISEKMLNAVRKLAMPHAQSPHEVVTISMGIATILPTMHDDMQHFVEQADKCLYRAKENGRNRAEWQVVANVK
ncbi:GGDEF domain-containing protein [Methylophilus luteus]|uniref:diguanylate cyclase n=1 Tax=Methylophilus luteus TaxID=640108 RepID=A0ABW3F650_9PROT